MAYSYDRSAVLSPPFLGQGSGDDPSPELFRGLIFTAIKRVGDGARAMGLGSVVKYNPQERINDNSRSVNGGFFLRFEHARVNPSWRPGILFYWDKGKEKGSVSSSNLVWGRKEYDNLPLDKMGKAMLDVAAAIVKDLKRQLDQEESKEVWSVASVGADHGYTTEVETFGSKSEAETAARRRGNCYVVKGTQMWNEPLGQVEEHDRTAQYKFFP